MTCALAIVALAGWLQWFSVSMGVAPKAYTDAEEVPLSSAAAAVESAVPVKAEVIGSNPIGGLPQEPSHLDLYVLNQIPTLREIRTVQPEPVATVAAASVGVEQWRSLVASIFPAGTVDNVLRVMQCESGGRVDATGSAGEKGLMQELPQFHQAKADALFGVGADLYNPVVNLSVAYVISAGGTSWAAWSCG